MSPIVFADAAGAVSAIAGAIAAIAAVVSIFYARQAASAGHEAVTQVRDLRDEDDYRAFLGALWEVFQATDEWRRSPGRDAVEKLTRRAQIRLRSLPGPRDWIGISGDERERLSVALDRDANAVDVYSAAAALIDDLFAAWERREAAREPRA